MKDEIKEKKLMQETCA